MALLLVCFLQRSKARLELPKRLERKQRTVTKILLLSLFINTDALVPAHSFILRTIILCLTGEMPTAQEITHSTELSQGGVNGVSGQPRLAEIYLDEISQWLMLLSPFI